MIFASSNTSALGFGQNQHIFGNPGNAFDYIILEASSKRKRPVVYCRLGAGSGRGSAQPRLIFV